jgi:hypothetical protein
MFGENLAEDRFNLGTSVHLAAIETNTTTVLLVERGKGSGIALVPAFHELSVKCLNFSLVRI